MHKASLFFIFEPCQGSKVRCLRSAPVRAGRGPPDLVRRLALVGTHNFLFVLPFMLHQIKKEITATGKSIQSSLYSLLF